MYHEFFQKQEIYSYNRASSENNANSAVVATIRSLPKSQRSLLNSLLILNYKHPKVYASQSFLGKRSNGRNNKQGVERVTANRGTTCLKSLGLIDKKRNYCKQFKKGCTYTVNPIFKRPSLAAQLKYDLPALQLYAYDDVELLKTNVTVNKCNLFKPNQPVQQRNIITRGEDEKLEVSEKHPILDSEIMNRIDSYMPLTLAGRINLAGFGLVVLEKALEALKTPHKKPNNQFSWLAGVCHRIKTELGLGFNWQLVSELYQVHGFDDSSEKIDKTRVIEQPKSKSSIKGESSSSPKVDVSQLKRVLPQFIQEAREKAGITQEMLQRKREPRTITRAELDLRYQRMAEECAKLESKSPGTSKPFMDGFDAAIKREIANGMLKIVEEPIKFVCTNEIHATGGACVLCDAWE